ncbi:MAG: DUF58 domain-containing protein [Candidatus Synoicihabitans palmerolidicus]|nr:DUF58 domain-containing protein [Candidatus Synoicihabitans palmerolidicus]
MPSPPFRVGQTGCITIELRNRKKLLPTYGLWFEVCSKAEPKGRRLVLRQRLDPGNGSARLDFNWQPTERGHEVVELTAIGSLFPFGFLRKVLACEIRAEVLVWPASVEYQRFAVLSPQRRQSGHSVARLGPNGDLLAVRKYASGDSHRQIHWQASARLRLLMIRQFSSEHQDGFSLRLDSPTDVWTRPEQFELACSFAATLAEDLFTTGRLGTVTLNLPLPIRGVRDLEAFFALLAELKPHATSGQPSRAPFTAAKAPSASTRAEGGRARFTLTFAPEGARRRRLRQWTKSGLSLIPTTSVDCVGASVPSSPCCPS